MMGSWLQIITRGRRPPRRSRSWGPATYTGEYNGSRSGSEAGCTRSLPGRGAERVTVEFGERPPGEPAAVVDVRARDVDRTVGQLPLVDLEHVLGAGRADRDEHDAVGGELLHQGRRNVVDATG